ncbi:MAG: hypothetical protein IPH53_19470 [Flavobacteriales bacterium]|nr:hypothetical protein [Flavobacteriales bacterium]
MNIPPPAGYGEYMEFSLQKLVFAPYAFHRNITATGTMIIDGATTLNSSLLVANGARPGSPAASPSTAASTCTIASWWTAPPT